MSNPLYSTNIAYKRLSDDARSLTNLLADWEKETYPEAEKERKRQLKQTLRAMELIEKDQ